MNKNIVLKFTSITLKVFRVLIAVLFICSLILGLAAFGIDEYESGIFFENGEVIFNKDSDKMSMNEYARQMPLRFIFTLIQNLALLFYLYKITGELSSVIKSINSLKTFTSENILAFKNISLYAIIIFGIQSIIISPDKISFIVHFSTLVGSALAFILSEVFKEGQKLLEENELTV
jgi:hypothetical protein